MFAASVTLTIAAVILVSYLTMQCSADTISTQQMAVKLFPFAFQQHHHNVIWLHLQLNNPRRLAHIYEFGFLGLAASLAALSMPFPKRDQHHLKYWEICLRMVLCILFCSGVSFMDQIHKIYVAGRHFDYLDLRLDAIGYVGAALAVTVLYLIVTHRLVERTEAFLGTMVQREYEFTHNNSLQDLCQSTVQQKKTKE